MDVTTQVIYAHWLRRAAGLAIDAAACLLPALAVDWAGGWEVGSPLYWVAVAIFIAIIVANMAVRQGRTGQTIGKQLLGTRLVSEIDLQPIGPLNSFVRLAMHQIVDQLPVLLGYVWPLWDAKRQTFADKVMRTIVIRQPAAEARDTDGNVF